jgi:hypothetical protein
VWRGDERILNKEDIFDEDDNNLELVVIKGIDNPIDIDAEEQQRNQNESDPINNIPKKNKAIDSKKSIKPKKVK